MNLDRLATQFKVSENIKTLLTSLSDDETESTLDDLLNNRLLDSAVGKQLDGLGKILGLNRPFLSVDVQGVFGFLTDPTSLAFGDINNLDLGGNFVDYTATRQLANDDTYRKLLKAKTIINSSSMTAEETIRTISVMFDNAKVRYALTTNLSPTYTIEKVLTAFEIGLLEILPKLLGIDNVTYIAIDEVEQFGFLGDDDSLGFTDIYDNVQGGNFAIIL